MKKADYEALCKRNWLDTGSVLGRSIKREIDRAVRNVRREERARLERAGLLAQRNRDGR